MTQQNYICVPAHLHAWRLPASVFLWPAKLYCHQSSVSMLTSLSYASHMFWASWLPKLRMYPLLWLLTCLCSFLWGIEVEGLRWDREQDSPRLYACLQEVGITLWWGLAAADFLTTAYVSVLLALGKINGFTRMYGKCILIIAGSTFSWGADGSLGFGLGKMIAARLKDRNLMGTALLWQSSRMILLYSEKFCPVNTK